MLLEGLPPLTSPQTGLRPDSFGVAAGAGAVAQPDDGLRLTQLLCSRLCHDLIGPVGVAASGSDLLALSEASGPEAMALIIDSAKQAARRLAFYRIAFGYGRGGGSGPGFGELKALANAYFAGGRISLVWIDARISPQQQTQPLAMPVARLLACLLLVAAETLPRGGALSVTLASTASAPGGLSVRIAAEGQGARLSIDTADALGGSASDTLNARTVVAFYVHRLSSAFGSVLQVTADQPGAVIFEIDITAAGAGCTPLALS
jgi:histidine phosphotransferase ChpT